MIRPLFVEGKVSHLCIDICYFFDCAAFVGPSIASSDYASVGTLTEFFDECIVRIDNKCRIKSLKRVSCHLFVIDLASDKMLMDVQDSFPSFSSQS